MGRHAGLCMRCSLACRCARCCALAPWWISRPRGCARGHHARARTGTCVHAERAHAPPRWPAQRSQLRASTLARAHATQGALFTCMCAAVYCSEVGEGMLSPRPPPQPRPPAQSASGALLTRLSDAVASATARGQHTDSVEDVIARFINYASCGLALTMVVPAAFHAMGLR